MTPLYPLTTDGYAFSQEEHGAIAQVRHFYLFSNLILFFPQTTVPLVVISSAEGSLHQSSISCTPLLAVAILYAPILLFCLPLFQKYCSLPYKIKNPDTCPLFSICFYLQGEVIRVFDTTKRPVGAVVIPEDKWSSQHAKKTVIHHSPTSSKTDKKVGQHSTYFFFTLLFSKLIDKRVKYVTVLEMHFITSFIIDNLYLSKLVKCICLLSAVCSICLVCPHGNRGFKNSKSFHTGLDPKANSEDYYEVWSPHIGTRLLRIQIHPYLRVVSLPASL